MVNLLIFTVYTKEVVEPAPAQETFYECYPGDYDYDCIAPTGLKLRSYRTKPPKCQRETQNSVYDAKILFHFFNLLLIN
jgi:hypothetical protein